MRSPWWSASRCAITTVAAGKVASTHRGGETHPRTPFALRGSGGMAKAVLAALVDSGLTDGTVLARNEAAGRALADRYRVTWAADLGDARPPLLVNATPIGMTGGPGADALAFPAEAITAATTVLESVYLPVDTPLVRAAASRATTLPKPDGLGRCQRPTESSS